MDTGRQAGREAGREAGRKVAGFAAVAVVAFGAALAIGKAVGPVGDEPAGHGHDDVVALSPDDGGPAGDDTVLDLDRTVYDAGRQRLSFTLRDGAGEPITAFEERHEKLLHLVVVRRDLGGYRHVHPTLDAATGEWSVPLDLGAGTWRVFADFTPDGGSASLAEADVSVAGDFEPTTQGPDNETDAVDGFEVHLAREDGMLRLHVRRDGADVTDLEPYLGAYGHLVAIRADDLAYLHVHPQDGAPGPEVAFHAALDRPGRYRLFFEFQHGGAVHRAQFDVTVADDAAPATDDGHDGHDMDEMDDMGGMEESGGHDH